MAGRAASSNASAARCFASGNKSSAECSKMRPKSPILAASAAARLVGAVGRARMQQTVRSRERRTSSVLSWGGELPRRSAAAMRIPGDTSASRDGMVVWGSIFASWAAAASAIAASSPAHASRTPSEISATPAVRAGTDAYAFSHASSCCNEHQNRKFQPQWSRSVSGRAIKAAAKIE